MDERSEERLSKLLKKSPAEITKEDGAFMRARISYLSETDKTNFEVILNQNPKKGTVKKKNAKK